MISEALRQRLLEADEDFKTAVIPQKNVPDGDYQAVIDSVEIKESQAGNLILAWQLSIIDGDYIGRKLFLNNNLEGQYAWIAKQNLSFVGLDVDSLMDLDNRLIEIVEKHINITVKTTVKDGKTYHNAYINEPKDDEEVSI